MHTKWPRSRISPSLSDVCPTIAIFPEICGPGTISRSECQRHTCQRLRVQPLLGVIPAVDEEVTFSFVEVAPRANVFQVGRRNAFAVLTFAIGTQCGIAATKKPIIGLRLAVQVVQHHLFVVAEQRYEMTFFAQNEQLVDDLSALRPAVDTVAQLDERVLRLRVYQLDQLAQGNCASMNVADRNDTPVHAVPQPNGLERPPKLWPLATLNTMALHFTA